MTQQRQPRRDEPWMFRTYAGFGTARATNERFKTNLSKGQTGLSVAFDLPTQTGYDSDHPMARGEVGRVGVPISGLGDVRTLFEGIPLATTNTSMTINSTAMWLLALYIVEADEQGAPRAELSGTTQNDILKEFLARGTYIFPPEQSMRLTTDIVAWTVHEIPRWNPINVCSYHLQEAGADPVLEIAFALANAIATLDAVKASGRVEDDVFPRLVGRISFFVNAGVRFVEEMCKMRAFTRLWDRVARERYGVDEEKYRRFRYGVQVNSLGLTALQPENNLHRIVLEMLAVTLSKDARARAVQLPAWNEALGLPRAWDQQWMLRAQQVLAYETDLLEYGDLFDGSKVIEEETDRIETEAWEEVQRVLDLGGAVHAIEHMKDRLVAANAARLREIESGERILVGVNRFTETELSPLEEGEAPFDRADPAHDAEQLERLEQWRATRDASATEEALDALRRAAEEDGADLMEPSLAAARAGVTTGEWTEALRGVFGEFRAPTGVSAVPSAAEVGHGSASELAGVQQRVADAASALGVARVRMLVGKPGLDGHSNAAEQVALRARDAGMEVVYQGIRLMPAEIAQAAADEDVHVVGLSILSGAHAMLVPETLAHLRERGVEPSVVPVIVGGVIPDDDAAELLAAGVARIFTPREHDITEMIGQIADILVQRAGD